MAEIEDSNIGEPNVFDLFEALTWPRCTSRFYLTTLPSPNGHATGHPPGRVLLNRLVLAVILRSVVWSGNDTFKCYPVVVCYWFVDSVCCHAIPYPFTDINTSGL